MTSLLVYVEGVHTQSAPVWSTERSIFLNSVSTFFERQSSDHDETASVRLAVS